MGIVVGAVAGDAGDEPGFSRRSRLTLAGGVRRDNWSKGRLRCSWTGIFSGRKGWHLVLRNDKFRTRTLKITRGMAPRRGPLGAEKVTRSCRLLASWFALDARSGTRFLSRARKYVIGLTTPSEKR
jgi:hypothetical protein